MGEIMNLGADLVREKNALINALDKSLYDWALGDIKRASIEGSAKMAGFILGACFIDAMAGFWAGTYERDKGPAGIRFKCFVHKYLSQYDEVKLWKDLRCGLAHSYAEGGTYVLTDGKRGLHRKKHHTGKTILNLEDFIEDLEKAYYKLVEDIRQNNDIFCRAKMRFESMDLMGPVPLHGSESESGAFE